MSAVDELQHDVLVIGGGGAGLRAAIAVAQEHPDLSIGIVSKVYPMRSHTVAAEGGMAAVIKDNDSAEDHIYDTISGSDWLADQDAVEMFVEEAPRELIQLEHWGCPWSREATGHVAVRPFGGMKLQRTWFATDKTGFHVLHSLFQTCLQFSSITRYDEWFATKLLVDDGRCQGCTAIELRTGQLRPIYAKSVIIATGGFGRIFPFTTNGAIKTGDGLAMAYRAGVALKDMEFVQYHPTGLPGTGILITEASRGEGGVLRNNKGERYLADYDLGEPLPLDDPRHPQLRTMELGPRDRLSQAFIKEQEKGNTYSGTYGDYVHLDIQHLGEHRIDTKLPFVRELARNYGGIDPVTESIPVRPVVHYMMGGIDTDIEAATSLPGLYAAGECACVSINGANRLGSNSLTELVVFGARAGRNAANFASTSDPAAVDRLESQVDAERARIRRILEQPSGGERVAELRRDMTSTMEEGAGIYRTQEGIEQTYATLSDLRERFGRVDLDDRTNVYNTDLISALELDYMLDISLALAASARDRTESRGSHQRTDHPDRDDEHFLKHSLASRGDDGTPAVSFSDVVITKWPPGSRTYGSSDQAKAAKSES
ncbi:MAG: fumarate reductase (quinol) flavoprotein subunit [Chloroflexi bacterium]|nr:fumarate reductase (quinol) flavoprotein subunit [Chloroflexota bacterium]